MKSLEIHIDLTHADLMRHDGTLDTARVARLCEVIGPAVSGALDDDGKHGVVMTTSGTPLAYWLVTGRDAPTEED